MVLAAVLVSTSREQALILWFEEVNSQDVDLVGGKNSSLGEMIQQLTPKGIHVPTGFATTAYSYRHFVESAGLDAKLRELLEDLDVDNVENLQTRGKQARQLILNTPFPEDLSHAIAVAYHRLCQRYGQEADKDNDPHTIDVAVRSSATAEDLPEASFAGQFFAFLHK